LRGRRGLLAGRLRLRGGRDLLPLINRQGGAPAPESIGYRTCRKLGHCDLCRLQGTQYFLQPPRLDLGGLAGFAHFSRSESPSFHSAPERVLQGGMFEFAGQHSGRTRRRHREPFGVGTRGANGELDVAAHYNYNAPGLGSRFALADRRVSVPVGIFNNASGGPLVPAGAGSLVQVAKALTGGQAQTRLRSP